MDLLTFTTARNTRLMRADDELAPFVVRALAGWTPSGEWYAELVEAASVLWLEIFEAEAPNADPDRFMPRFHDMLGESLSQTAKPSDPPDEAQANRLTYWISTVTVNNATYWGNGAHGGNAMRWHSMNDESVRGTHRAADGQIASRDGTFDIGGFDLRYPGEPVGPPEVWINCRCILVPARVEGAFDVTDAITADGTLTTEPEVEEENPDIVPSVNEDDPDEDEELITEIPVHGLIAPESVLSGDYRVFAEGALSNRILPIPLRYEFVSSHGGDTSHVATVGRVDEIFMHEEGMRWRGAIVVTKQYASEVVEGLVDRTIRGVSLDGDMGVVQVDEDGFPGAMSSDSPLVFEEVRVAGLTIVPIPAFQEAYIAFGHEFADELTEEQIIAAAQALEDCGCTEQGDGYDVLRTLLDEIGDAPIIDLTEFSAEELAEYEALATEDEQVLYANAHGAIIASAFRDVSPEERRKLADDNKAMPDGSYPIANVDDLRNAIQAIGRAKNPDAVKAHIKRRARALGHEDLIPEDWALVAAAFAPGTKDGPGWITHPIPTARIRRYWVKGEGAAKIRWGAPGDFNRCRLQLAKYVQNPEWLAGLCANMHKEALGFWPAEHDASTREPLTASAAPIFNLVASGSVKPSLGFSNPGLVEPTTTTIEEIEGGYLRIFGHLAAWGVCHIGIQDTCVTPPHSLIDYAMFRTGTVRTDGGRIAVGQITMGTGHAGLKVNARTAVAHYDNTGTAVADVVVGEDSWGIWFSGLLRPNVTQEQIDALEASALSGDWRRNGTALELVAALAVNVPGFPIPRTSLAASGDDGQESLVAAGIVQGKMAEEGESMPVMKAEDVAGIVRASIREMRAEEERDKRVAALAPFADRSRESVLTRVKAKFGQEG